MLTSCREWPKRYMVENWLVPTLLKDGKTEVQVSNIIITASRERLERMVAELHEKTWGRLKRIFGLVADGGHATLLVYEGGSSRVEAEGEVADVVRRLAQLFCAQEKLPAAGPRCIVVLFGVQRGVHGAPKKRAALLDLMREVEGLENLFQPTLFDNVAE